jgi:hypothetical protein
MTSSDDSAKIAGVTLSALIHDVTSFGHDSEGLLFGSVHIKEFQAFDDTQTTLPKQIQTTLAIQGYAITGDLGSFYDGCGCVDLQRLTPFITSHKQEPIGWFRFRRGVPLRPTLREMNICRHLQRIYPQLKNKSSSPKESASPPPFVFALLSHSLSEDHTVHAFDYRLFRLLSTGDMKPMTFHVMNLISGSQEEYLDFNPISSYLPSTSTSLTSANTKSSDAFSEQFSLLHSIPNTLTTPPPQLTALENYYKQTLDRLAALAKDVKSTEQQIRQLENEIRSLKSKRMPNK